MEKYIKHILKIHDFNDLLEQDNFASFKAHIDVIILTKLKKDEIIDTKPVVDKLLSIIKSIEILYDFETVIEVLNWLLITIKDIEFTSVEVELYNISANSYKIYNELLLWSKNLIS